MWRRISIMGNFLTKIESWWALAGMIAGTGALAWLGQSWELLSQQGWPAILIVALIGSSLVVIALSLAYLAFSRYRSHKETHRPASMTSEPPVHLVEIREQTFRDTNVLLDGHRYISCTFIRCTLQWDGDKFDVVDPKWEGGYNLATTHPIARQTMNILRWLNMIDKSTAIAEGRIRKE
jgi:hypothetical protein